MSYASDLGYKVGDKFRVIEDLSDIFNKGEVVVLEDDDETRCPLFISLNRPDINNFMYIIDHEKGTKEVEKIEEPKTISVEQLIDEIRADLPLDMSLLEVIKRFIKEFSQRFYVYISINDKGFSLCFDGYEFNNLDDNGLMNKMNLLEQLFGDENA